MFKKTTIMGYEDLQKLAKRQKWAIRILSVLLVILIYLGLVFGLSQIASAYLEKWFIPEVPTIHAAKASEIKSEAMTTEEYIKFVFGKDAKMALAISQAENGTRACDRTNWNTNKTTDYGVFMINSIHLKKGYKLADLIDCHKNVDIAYGIFKAQSWTPWTVFKTGAYKKFLK